MSINIRHLDDPSNTTGTLLTLPLSDFHHHASANDTNNNDALVLIRLPAAPSSNALTMNDLILGQTVYILGDTSENDIEHVAAAISNGGGGGGAMGAVEEAEENGNAADNNIHVPIAARLIVEGEKKTEYSGKTLDLMRVETSNTYIVVPPMPLNDTNDTNNDDQGESSSINKRRKLNNGTNNDTTSSSNLTTMPARSIGVIPGEESPSTFFLDPVHLHPGHYGNRLRSILGRWVFDPLDPPFGSSGSSEGMDKKFGYTLSELSHICRTSQSEMEYALHYRVFGAEDALVIPAVNGGGHDDDGGEKRYGILSEEGRQTVSMAIVSALLESDLDLVYAPTNATENADGKEGGTDINSLMKEIRTHWHNLEGEGAGIQEEEEEQPVLTDSQHEASQDESQSQFYTPAEFSKLKTTSTTTSTTPPLADEVIWHCLRPILQWTTPSLHKDTIPPPPNNKLYLLPDQVAKLAAHNVFLRDSSSRSANATITTSMGWWNEEELMEEWSLRLPSMMGSGYEPSVDLLKGVAISELVLRSSDDGGAATTKQQQQQQHRRWQYLPEAALPLIPSLRIKSMLAMHTPWTVEEALPYLEKFILRGIPLVDNNNDDVKDDDVKKANAAIKTGVAELLGKYAKAVSVTEKKGEGGEEDVIVTKYVALLK